MLPVGCKCLVALSSLVNWILVENSGFVGTHFDIAFELFVDDTVEIADSSFVDKQCNFEPSAKIDHFAGALSPGVLVGKLAVGTGDFERFVGGFDDLESDVGFVAELFELAGDSARLVGGHGESAEEPAEELSVWC